MKNDDKIDLVVLWVDGNDPEWQKEKAKYDVKSNADGSIIRYRDWDLLEYFFRGIEKFAPWVNNIFFVTWGHIPKWLNTDAPKLKIIKHTDYIPEKYLPTFNANAIENNIHRIKGLSEKFIFLNDDFYFIKDTKPEDFFIGNTPRDSAVLNVHCVKKSLYTQYMCVNDVGIINEHFDFKKSFKENKWKYINLKNGRHVARTLALKSCPRFPGFWQHHLASAFLKSTFEKVWKEEPEILEETTSHKFRGTTDVNQWLFKEWQIAEGNFIPRSIKFGTSFYVDRDGIDTVLPKAVKYIRKQKGHMIAINDGPMSEEKFDHTISELKEAFNSILPEKSIYEK